jgi:RNA polymerase sigma-70 factor (ECF subfamily)
MLTKAEFKCLFDTYFDRVRRFVFYRCGDKNTASDVAQDVFLRIWEKRDRWNSEYMKPEALLCKMANDAYVSIYRKELCRINFRQSMVLEYDCETSPEDKMLFEELAATYAETLAQMPETQRIVFLMSREDGMKYKEIADCLHISVKAVEKRMRASLLFIKARLLNK